MQVTSNVTSCPKATAAGDIRVHVPVQEGQAQLVQGQRAQGVGPVNRAACGHMSLGQWQDVIGLPPALLHSGPQLTPGQKGQERILKRQISLKVTMIST